MADVLVDALAEQLIREHSLSVEDVEGSFQGSYGDVWELVELEVKNLDPATLGIIAATGRGESLYRVHSGSYLDKYGSGIELLRIIAVSALLCRMLNILTARSVA